MKVVYRNNVIFRLFLVLFLFILMFLYGTYVNAQPYTYNNMPSYGYKFLRVKVDSSFIPPIIDSIKNLNKKTNLNSPSGFVYVIQDSSYYGYNGVTWTKFSFIGSSSDSNAFIKGGNNFTTDSRLGLKTKHNLKFIVEDSSRVIIDTFGNVGIGKQPVNLLDLKGTGSTIRNSIYNANSSGATRIQIGDVNGDYIAGIINLGPTFPTTVGKYDEPNMTWFGNLYGKTVIYAANNDMIFATGANSFLNAITMRIFANNGRVSIGLNPQDNGVDKLQVDGSISVGVPRIISGIGVPNGTISAPVGSIYLRQDGTTGNTFYVKETGGTGNTGWVNK